MIDTERLTELQNLITLTKKMLILAHEGNWELLITLESERSIAIKHFFSLPSIPEETEQIRLTLEKVISLDKEIYPFVKTHRDVLGLQLNELSKSRSAAQAYLKNAK